jgi:hypothetical protein
MDIKKILGAILTLGGIVLLLYAGYAFLRGGTVMFGTEVTAWEALVPFIIGVIFLGYGFETPLAVMLPAELKIPGCHQVALGVEMPGKIAARLAVQEVNASVLGPRVPLRNYPLADWRQVIDVNVTGVLVPTQAVLSVMREAGGGSIISVSSGVGDRPRPNWGAYAVSKWAVEAFTYNLALEEADAGIRANVVDPGAMRTRMRRAAYPDEDPDTLPQPDAVTGVFLWLASGAADRVTGQRFRAQEWRRPV